MPHYLARFSYTQEGWASLVEQPQNREAAIRPMFEALGGTMENLWYAFGSYDGFVVYELPDNVSAAAISAAVAASDAIAQFETTPLISVAEMVKALEKAQSVGYHPPTEAVHA